MAAGGMGLAEVRALWQRTKSRSAERDDRMRQVLAVRQGRMQDVFPDLMPDGPFNGKAIVGNMVDVAARDLAESLAPLPSFNCSSAKMVTDAARRFAEKRTKIVNGYVEFCDLQVQMYTAGDRYFTYGFVPGIVEPDMDAQTPRIRFLDSIGAYPIYDRWGNVSAAFFSFFKTRDELCAMYPHAEGVIGSPKGNNELVEVVRYHDKHVDMLFLPAARSTGPGAGRDEDGLILEKAANPVGECLVVWVSRPGVDVETHGQFDDVLAVQVAKARFALLSLEAAQKAVQAPIVMPSDVQELSLGPDSVLRTNSGEKVRRVPLDIPQSAFAQQGMLDQELKAGARYPDARGGNMDASIVTGRGVQALMDGYDTQIRTGQAMFAWGLKKLVRLALAMDEALWPNLQKTMRFNAAGTPFEVKYTPANDIKGDWTVDVQYGLMAGLDPNRALVFGLQARGDKLISREFLQTQLPFSMNASEEAQRVDMEEMRDALKQAVAGYAQSIPVLAQNGQDPGEILRRIGMIIRDREKGTPIEVAVSEAFTPETPPPGVEQPDAAAPTPSGLPGEVPPGGGPLPGMQDSGLMQGVAPGQAGMPPGGRPDMAQLFAGIGAGGAARMTAGVERRIPI